jgi:hypothetical protein
MHPELGDGMSPPPLNSADFPNGSKQQTGATQASPSAPYAGAGTISDLPGTQPNPVPAEVAARIGLMKGFLENYDSIHSQLDKLGTLRGRTEMVLGTGPAAEIKRHIETGMEALVRMLTGAGKSQEEATSYASRYAPSALDQPFDTKSKLEGLKYDIEHTAAGMMEGRGGFVSPAGKTTPKANTAGWKIEVAH